MLPMSDENEHPLVASLPLQCRASGAFAVLASSGVISLSSYEGTYVQQTRATSYAALCIGEARVNYPRAEADIRELSTPQVFHSLTCPVAGMSQLRQIC